MKTELLRLLRGVDGYVSGQELCRRLGVSRTAVWKAIRQLKDAGYEIEAVQNRGYRLLGVPDILSETELKSVRRTEWVGEEIFCFPVVDSTNTKAKQLAEEGCQAGALVVAERQEAGKGRRGRDWDSSAGSGIYMTLVLRPDIRPDNASMLTLVAALAVSVAIENRAGVAAGIKWPNDIVLNGKKVCGILTEMSAQSDYVNHIVVGIGINVHNEAFPKELAQTATSLWQETGMHCNRAALIGEVLWQFEHFYKIYLRTQDLSALAEEYKSRLVNLHKKVNVLDPEKPFEGIAVGITPRGELIVDTDDGSRLVSAGEVSVRGIYGYV